MADPQKTSRRQFLAGRAAADAATDWIDRRAADGPMQADSLAADTESYLVHFCRRAMACDFELSLNAGQYPDAAQHVLAALDLVDHLESQMTVYREDSEIMEINRRAAGQPVPVEPRLFDLLQICLEIHEQTEGAFDITAGPLIRAWGFHRRQGTMPSKKELQAALALVGSDKIELDSQRSTIRFKTPGVELNLGSIGKGYALDRCAEDLLKVGIENYFFHGGRSSVLAHGQQAEIQEKDESAGWNVGVADPLRPGKRLGRLRLRDRGLGTSGSGAQFFRYRGRRYGHILDPRTGLPAEGVLSATVLAPTAARADALATAFYAMGWNQAAQFCRNHDDLALMMVCREPKGGPASIKTVGFSKEELTITSSP